MMNHRSESPLGRMLSLIEIPSVALRFLILDCPTESTLPHYLEEFKRYQVAHVVRCCQPTYNTSLLNDEGIQVHDLPFKDGGVPPAHVVAEWLSLIDSEERREQPRTIAVHCVAGLGRAPALVAIALIEFGVGPLDAIEFIRRKRRGAFNKPQIAFLDHYKPVLRTKTTHSLKTSLTRMFRFGSTKKQVPSGVPLSSCV
ncbi:protein-tyrosine phosphatase-like protein [Sporodiniella umbellata]|nr:protein-tyrosine phosphatase-like protein [Sporodiniella umbellata]